MAQGVTVVIAARDAEATLRRALRSVQAQKHPVQQIVVVDDGSIDGTADLVRELATTDSRIELVTGAGAGAGHARNLGIAVARHELVAFLDSDDVWYPDKISAQLPLLTEDVVLVGVLVHYLSEEGAVLGSYLPFEEWDEASASLRAAETMPLALSTLLVRRRDLDAVGGFDETFHRTQDLELAQRLVADGRGIAWPKGRALAGYLVHGGGVSATSYEEQFLAAELVRARVRGRTDASYAEWQESPQLDATPRRALRSGRRYRLAAVATGAGDRVGIVCHGALAVAHDPLGVARKLARRRRHTVALQPAEPPAEVMALFGAGEAPAPTRVADVPTVDLSGLHFACDPVALGDAAVRDYLDDPRTLVLLAAHVTALNAASDDEFVAAFNAAEGRYVDGISWSLIAKAQGDVATKMATSDLAPALLRRLSAELGRPVRLAVLGGEPPQGDDSSTAVRAGERLALELPVEVVAAGHGYRGDWGPTLTLVREARPDVLLVGLGMPKEAVWTRDHRDQLPPAIVMSCGGWLRILAGEEARAPQVLQDHGLEWLHRLTTDPARTLGRYTRGAVSLGGHLTRALSRRTTSRDG